MKSLLVTVAACIGLSTNAVAGPMWESFGFQVKSQDAEASLRRLTASWAQMTAKALQVH